VNEPDNLTAWANGHGVWVRVDSDLSSSWHLLCGDGFDVVSSAAWSQVDTLGTFVKADTALTRMAVDKVRQTLELAS
jgi:hypothetical protein